MSTGSLRTRTCSVGARWSGCSLGRASAHVRPCGGEGGRVVGQGQGDALGAPMGPGAWPPGGESGTSRSRRGQGLADRGPRGHRRRHSSSRPKLSTGALELLGL
jgi:hypothetical protein